MFLFNRYIILFGILLSISSFIWFKFYNLHKELETITYQLDKSEAEANQLILELAIEKGNTEKLKETLNETNDTIKKLTLSKEYIESEFTKFKNTQLQDKIKNQNLKTVLNTKPEQKVTCEYGIRLNYAIKDLKYEDF